MRYSDYPSLNALALAIDERENYDRDREILAHLDVVHDTIEQLRIELDATESDPTRLQVDGRLYISIASDRRDEIRDIVLNSITCKVENWGDMDFLSKKALPVTELRRRYKFVFAPLSLRISLSDRWCHATLGVDISSRL